MHGIIRQTYYYELQYPDGTVGIAPIEQFYLGTVLWKFGMNFGTGNQSASWYSPTAIIELGDIYTISNASKTMISSFSTSLLSNMIGVWVKTLSLIPKITGIVIPPPFHGSLTEP